MTLKITFHDGTEILTKVDSFDPDALAEKINNREILMIAIGSVIVNKTSIKLIELVESV